MNLTQWTDRHMRTFRFAGDHNPLRIHDDGIRRVRDIALSIEFNHRQDRDFILPYSSDSVTVSPHSALAYLRQRVRSILPCLDMPVDTNARIAVWRTGELRDLWERSAWRMSDGETESVYHAHVAICRDLRDLLGDEIFNEFVETSE